MGGADLDPSHGAPPLMEPAPEARDLSQTLRVPASSDFVVARIELRRAPRHGGLLLMILLDSPQRALMSIRFNRRS